MADSSKSSQHHRTDEAENLGQGIVEQLDADPQEETVLVASEPIREELVNSAVGFLRHPKAIASSDARLRSFLGEKGLTVDEINEAFRRLASPSSDAASSVNTAVDRGAFNNTCSIPQEKKENATNRMDDSGRPESASKSVEPMMPCHPRSYMEIIEMIQRGEKPDDIQEINDKPPNPDQPLSKPRIALRPKPWEKQGQQKISWDIKSQSSDSKDVRLEHKHDNADFGSGPTDSSDQRELSPQEPSVLVSEEPPAAAANLEEAATTAREDGVEQKEKFSQPAVEVLSSSAGTAPLDCSPPAV